MRGKNRTAREKAPVVSLCRWTKSALQGGRNCYKHIYGIKSHRCLQMSPVPEFCTFSCEFCWRKFRKRFKAKKYERPNELIKRVIERQRMLVSGFGGAPKVSREMWKEAMQPRHFAISLDGEPTLYPYLAELIKEVKARGMSVFLVTNGSLPKKLKELLDKNAIPDNLAISVYATNDNDYMKITNSFIKAPLDKVKESLKLMRNFEDCRTNFRMTLVNGLNLKDAEGYAKLIKIAKPKFITIKGYSYLGQSINKLKRSNMPYMAELERFAEEIKKHTNYIIKEKDAKSRAIILVKDEATWLWNMEKIKEQEKRFEDNAQ